MVLSAQCFGNLNRHTDIFNHSNLQFWEYMQPGFDSWGFISCTGGLSSSKYFPTLNTLVPYSTALVPYEQARIAFHVSSHKQYKAMRTVTHHLETCMHLLHKGLQDANDNEGM